MLENFQNFISTFGFQVVSSFLGIAGFFLSCHTKWGDRFKINLLYSKCAVCKLLPGFITFEMIVENRSKLPVSITSMHLQINNKQYDFEREPYFYSQNETTRNGVIIRQDTTYSTKIPFPLSGFGAIGGGFYFKYEDKITLNELSGNSAKIIIKTSRSKKRFNVLINDLCPETINCAIGQ